MRRVFVYCINCKEVVERGVCTHEQHTYHDNTVPNVHVFEPYYDRTLKAWVCSEKDRVKKMRTFGDSRGPRPLRDIRDNKKFIAEMAYIQKHREDYKSTEWKGYKPRTQGEIERQGEKSYDPNRPDRDSFRKRIYSYSK